MTRKSRLTAVTATAVLACAISACADTPAQPTNLVPQAYGVPGQCYYLDDPAEALALIAAGLCPTGWVPTVMPLLWHEQYYRYYASPAYYNTYVPVSYRASWPAQQNNFYTVNKVTIVNVQKQATYKDSKGKTVPGSKVNDKVTFGNGVKATTGFGNGTNGGTTGGSVPKPAPSAPKPVAPKPVPKPVPPKAPVPR